LCLCQQGEFAAARPRERLFNEQKAYNSGLANRFVQTLEVKAHKKAKPGWFCPAGIVMSYFDGNTVTALWNYAQRFAMSDRA
jgi:phospholipase C